MFRPPVILAVDPGARCGVAVLVRGRAVLVQTIRGDKVGDVAGALALVERMQEKHGMAVMVIEAQYVPRGRKQNPKALATLYKRRHIWEILATLYRVAVEDPVYPSTWKTVFREIENWDDDGKERTTKDKARAYVERYFPGRAKDGEQADALCIAHWRWRRT